MITYKRIERSIVHEAYADGLFGYGNPHAVDYINDADTLIAVADGSALLGVFGAQRVSLIFREGFIWFADTPILPLYRVGFLRSVHRVLELFFEEYNTLVGTSYDPRAVAWLTWLGAEFGAELLEEGRPFIFRRD